MWVGYCYNMGAPTVCVANGVRVKIDKGLRRGEGEESMELCQRALAQAVWVRSGRTGDRQGYVRSGG